MNETVAAPKDAAAPPRPWIRLGLWAALLSCLADQAAKLWLIYYDQLGSRGPIRLGPFLTLVLTWNTGISYGWLPQSGPYGQWALLALKLVAVALLWIWLMRTESKLSALAIGLIDLVVIIGLKQRRSRIPGVLVAVVFSILAVSAFNLTERGSVLPEVQRDAILAGADPDDLTARS